jgi:hypothetical protein
MAEGVNGHIYVDQIYVGGPGVCSGHYLIWCREELEKEVKIRTTIRLSTSHFVELAFYAINLQPRLMGIEAAFGHFTKLSRAF